MALPTPSAYWKMDDGSGNATDQASGGRTLVQTGTIGSGTGILGNCRTFTGNSANRFACASDSVLQTGNTDYTIAAWFQLSSGGATSNKALAVKSNSGGAEFRVWFLCVAPGSWRPRFTVFNAAASLSDSADWLTAPTNDAWHLLVAWLDSAANTLYLSVDDATPVSAPRTVTLTAGTSPFEVGVTDTTSWPWHGSIDEVLWYKGKLDAGQRTSLYNAGVGRTWSQAAGWGDVSNTVANQMAGIGIGLGIGV